ncbi:MAG: polyphosphate polymerase domain-containing protein [Lachnospiraceae bacterium]|nr:polyphosphate polymerase domain-containing protein [Lachnospiraceae bacterium]MBR6349118.1 polyphosphate polymerase domain-containing protein [Lachnospiraceae bacterium]
MKANIVENPITVMKRHEMKYLLNAEQTEYLRNALEGYMEIDEFGRTSIASLYYDTPDYRLIRASLERPAFKEKIRLRSYGIASESSPVYLELKRKADHVVYKRRIQSTVGSTERFFEGDENVFSKGQISSEIAAFRDHYKNLAPACLIIYDRTAYYEPSGSLRLTIDENPRYRMKDLTLTKSMDGTLLLPEGWTILEIKVQDAMPLWLADILDHGEIYKTSFSKYGEAYKREVKTDVQFNILSSRNTNAVFHNGWSGNSGRTNLRVAYELSH